MMRPTENNDSERLRDEIFKLFINNKVPHKDAEQVLSQSLSYVRDSKAINLVAEELGLKLSRFISTNVLEVYYDIEKEGREVGYISKGWEESGFRIGEIIMCEGGQLASFKANSDKILNVCATPGFGLGVKVIDNSLELDLNIIIYQDGFNAKVVSEALKNLELTVIKIKALIS